MWSLGIATHSLLVPTCNDTLGEIYRGDFNKLENQRNCGRRGLSAYCIDFVQRLANSNSRDRMTIEEALGHSWVQRHIGYLVEIRDRAVQSWMLKESTRGVDMSGIRGPFKQRIGAREIIGSHYAVENAYDRQANNLVTADGKLRGAAELGREMKAKRSTGTVAELWSYTKGPDRLIREISHRGYRDIQH